ncbi:MAG TPA: hypothetical protein PKV97_14655, partial [Thauera aminoaromatica]|nr:hypothetical protein [Thauera aminoaromatica]
AQEVGDRPDEGGEGLLVHGVWVVGRGSPAIVGRTIGRPTLDCLARDTGPDIRRAAELPSSLGPTFHPAEHFQIAQLFSRIELNSWNRPEAGLIPGDRQ